MQKYLKYIYLFSVLIIGSVFFAKAEVSGILSLSITPGFLILGNSGTIQIPTILSGTSYTITQSLQNTFMLEDKLLDIKGFYSTLQISDLYNGSNIISAKNISIQSLSLPQTILGKDNPLLFFGNGINTQTGSTQKPQTFFYRNAGIQGLSAIGRYGDTTTLNIQVPENQAPGDYKGTIYYLLFDKRDQ